MKTPMMIKGLGGGAGGDELKLIESLSGTAKTVTLAQNYEKLIVMSNGAVTITGSGTIASTIKDSEGNGVIVENAKSGDVITSAGQSNPYVTGSGNSAKTAYAYHYATLVFDAS